MKRFLIKLLPLTFLFLFSAMPVGHAATITVDTLDDTITPGNGCSLREAIVNANDDAATNPDCAAGSGTDDINFVPGLSGTILLTSGGLPYITTSLNINGPGPDVLTIDGLGLDSIFGGISGPITTISGLLLTKGVFVGEGGAIFVNGATLNLTNCVLQDNAASVDGGAISVDNSGTLNITNSVISGNAAGDDGGGIYIHSSATATITNSTISGNVADDDAGGINNVGTLTIENSTIRGNAATGDAGGGIRNDGTLTINNSTISGNGAAGNGGGIRNQSAGTLTINNSTISGNGAADNGGGIHNNGALTITNSTITGNTAEDGGGGVEVDDGTATFTHVTFTANMANSNLSGTNTGGGIHIQDGYVIITNTIIAGNLQTVGFLISNDCHLAFSGSGTLTATGKNLIQDPDCGDFDPTGDPNVITGVPADLNALADNGGVVLPHTFTNALRLVSAAVDTADPAFCPATDQRGVPRTPATCDIGAFELNAGMVQFSAADYSVDESGVTAIITVTRLGGSDGPITVDFATSNGSATDGVDYTATSGTLSWDANDTSDKTFPVTIIDDASVEGSETVNLTLTNATGGATIGAPNPALLTILDNDSPPISPTGIFGGGCSLGAFNGNTANAVFALLPLLFALGMAAFRKRA